MNTLGEKLKQLRCERDLSMRELAAQSGVSTSLISKIEADKVSPTVMSLQKLLESMNVDMYEFFLEKRETNPADAIVFKRSTMAVSQDNERLWCYAFPKHPDIKAELLYEEFQPNTKVTEKESHKGDICGYVISGELTIEVNGRGTFTAGEGDAFYLKAGLPHVTKNEGSSVLRIVSTQIKA